jgi:hypothetical protein
LNLTKVRTMKRIALVVACVLTTGIAFAKLPPLSDDAKAKAAEAAAKTAHGDKVGAYQLCQSMDRVAAKYFADAKKANREVKPAVVTPPCTDPGQFAMTPVAAKPLEAAGAHSPPGTVVSPPSTTAPAAAANPAPKAASKP